MASLTLDAQALDMSYDDLLARCRDGEPQAWRALFDEYHPFVHRIARRMGVADDELDDVVQKSFLIVFRKLSAFHHGRFTTWLYRIVANVVSEHHRRHRRRAALMGLLGRAMPGESPMTPEMELSQRETRVMVNMILREMAPKKREVFVLYELEGLAGDDIAEMVGCKVETVWSRLHYARRDFARLARRWRFLAQEGDA